MKKLPNILGLTDNELQQVTDAAATLEVGKRSLFLIWFVAFYEQQQGLAREHKHLAAEDKNRSRLPAIL